MICALPVADEDSRNESEPPIMTIVTAVVSPLSPIQRLARRVGSWVVACGSSASTDWGEIGGHWVHMRSVEDLRSLSDEDLDHLPGPVVRSLRRSGVVGRPTPLAVSLTQTGRIRPAEDKRWMKFTASETYDLVEPGFQWTASLRVGGMRLGKAVDTLAQGHGRMHVRVLGLIDILDASGPEMDQGALMRWFNETIWFPQIWASDLISWQPVDQASAVGSLESHGVVVTAEFRFDSAGRVVDFVADRYRQVDGDFELTRWSTPITAYSVFDGMELPSQGSAVWDLPDGDLEYIQITVDSLDHHTDV